MTIDELASQLYSVAEMRAQAVGRRFGEGAGHDLQIMTRRAADSLLAIDDDRERAAEIEAAKANLGLLIEMAIENARNIREYPPDLLGEQSYFPAKLRFCPCRPFC